MIFGGVHENLINRGELPKNGEFGHFADLRGDLTKKEGWCFWGGVETPMHTISWEKEKWCI